MAVLYSQKAIYMTSHSTLMDLYSVHQIFRDRMLEIIHTHPTTVAPLVVVDDFFDICTHRASDAVQFFDDAGTQRRHLDPNKIHRVMVSGHMQDIFFDEIGDYVFEANYFDNDAIENKFVHHDIASVCCNAVGEILRVIMGVVVQFPEGRRFFHPDNTKLNLAMTDLIIEQIPHRRDVKVTVRFE